MMPRNSSPIIDKEIICTYKIKLEKVLGVTVSGNAALDSDPDGTIAYPAGCTVVLFNTKTKRQYHIISTARKTITSLAFSSCGRYVVTGECGHQPAVRVWDLYPDGSITSPSSQSQQVCSFFGHKFGVNCVAFSPNGKYVVSIGTQHDMIVNVWDWKNNIKIASNKVSTKVKAVSFAENGSYFVTVGNRHVKFWYLESGKSKYKEAVPLMGRSAILGEQRNNYFCDVACGRGQCGDSTYAITRSGLLCEFNNRRLLDKWVELRTTSANCITVGDRYIFVGCAESIIRCFDPTTLNFVTTLPRTHHLGVDVSLGVNISHMSSHPPDAKYPDTIALTYNENTNKLTSVYNDHSIYVWDVLKIKRVGKSFSFLYHSACIWGVEMAPPNSPLPPGSFLTCSSDDTIRVWTLDKISNDHSRSNTTCRSNVYSNELLKIVYVDRDLNYIKDLDLSANNASSETSYDGRHGVRCMRVSPDGRNLASGDRSGNIRILDTATMKEMYKIEAHDAEVLCLEYFGTPKNVNLLASASRDRLLHVFDARQGYDLIQTLDDHSSSITAVRFVTNQNAVQMVSCGADKSLIFRSLGELNGRPQFNREHNATGKTTLYDMEVDTGQKHVITACQDRNVRIYSVNTAKHTKSFKGSTGEDGTLIKVVLDRSGIYLATSCTDKSLNVYDYYSGECMATMCGHSELATGLRFTNDCTRLISASGDGCIFVWRVPHDMVVTMHARLSQQAMRQGRTIETSEFLTNTPPTITDEDVAVNDNYRFSVGQLPQWAQKQLNDDTSPPLSLVTKNVAQPKGRWAERVVSSTPKFYSDRSNNSSLEETFEDITMTSTKQISSNVTTSREILIDSTTDTGFESTAHDGDIDSDNDYRHRPLYYPSQNDTASGSEFTVTNIDVEELRKSQRKKKVPQIVIQQNPTTYASNDSDDDDDDVSTPSGDNTDRNPMSLFSVSSESLDQLVTREKYLQSTFESLSGAESGSTPSKTSISSKFLARSGDINSAAINAVKVMRNDPEAMKKRQLLNKRIAETKKKLESVGHTSPLKYSQSIHDLSLVGADRSSSTSSSKQKQGTCVSSMSTSEQFDFYEPVRLFPITSNTNTKLTTDDNITSSSCSVPKDLQLCGCYMRDIVKNTSFQSSPLATPSAPRKLQLDKTLAKYKHKSLPVSPVSEERSFVDFVSSIDSCVDSGGGGSGGIRESFSYFVDLTDRNDSGCTDHDFKQICDDIEKFSRDFNKKYDRLARNHDDDEHNDNFSSDSLEDDDVRPNKLVEPRRCVSNNELSLVNRIACDDDVMVGGDCEKGASFFLNRSEDSILSLDDDDDGCYDTNRTKSYCNSMESILSNDSDCKSAPLEVLFTCQKQMMSHSLSLPKNMSGAMVAKRTIETQTDFDLIVPTLHEVVVKKRHQPSEEFREKLSKFESRQPISFFVSSSTTVAPSSRRDRKPILTVNNSNDRMSIPSLHDKNRQYRSRYCNVLNNKSELRNLEIFEQKGGGGTTANVLNVEKNTNRVKVVKETTSLDRHLFAKGLLLNDNERKICHKPPKAVRRHSSKNRKMSRTYEYVKKEDYYNNKKRDNLKVTDENTIEFAYKEKIIDKDLDGAPNFLNELYDSLDKSLIVTKLDCDSLEVNLAPSGGGDGTTSAKNSNVNIWNDSPMSKFDDNKGEIQSALENLKILNEIQRKIAKINVLVDTFKRNVCEGKVKALSNMYEHLSTSQSYYNDLTTATTKLQANPIKFRRRNLSLPCFIERRLNFETVRLTCEVYINVGLDSPDSNLRRSCSLSDLSMNAAVKTKQTEPTTGGKKGQPATSSRAGSRYAKNNAITRSRSISVLNKTDSDDDDGTANVNRLMRPTISSHNKMNKSLQQRKKQSYSTSNLNSVGVDNVSTSEDEMATTAQSAKPVVTPRNRNPAPPPITPRSKHLNNNNKTLTNRYYGTNLDVDSDLEVTLTNSTGQIYSPSDLSTLEVTRQVYGDAMIQLSQTADKVMTLYNRLNAITPSLSSSDNGGDNSSRLTKEDKSNILKSLEMSILKTHKTMHEFIFTKIRQTNGNLDVNQTDTVKKLNDLVSKKPTGTKAVVQMMDQYSEILLDMVQQKMHNSNI